MRAASAGGGSSSNSTLLPGEQPPLNCTKPEVSSAGEQGPREDSTEFQFVLGPAMPNCWEPAVVPLASSSSSLIVHGTKSEEGPPPPPERKPDVKSSGQQQGPKQASCYQCKLSKVRCNREVPCERCVRLDLACLPLKRSRGASLKLHKTKKQLAAELAAAASSSSSASTKSQPVGVDLLTDAGHHTALRIRQRRIGQGNSNLSGKGGGPNGRGEGGGGDADPNQHVWVHVVAATPTSASEGEIFGRCAEVMSSAFSQMKAEGRVNDHRTALLLKSWSLSSHRHKVDVSKGVCGMMLKVLGDPLYTLGTPAPDPNVPSDHRLTDHQGNFFNVQCLPLYLKQLMDPVSAVAGYISYLGEFQLISNACFSDKFMTVEDMEYKYRRAQVLPDFLWSSLLDPEELTDFYTRYVEYMCSEPRPNKQMSCVSKCVDRLGNVFIGFIRLRAIFAEGGNYASEVLSIVPLPGSRHVTYLGDYDWGPDLELPPGVSASSVSESSTTGGKASPPHPPHPPPPRPPPTGFWSPQKQQGSDTEGEVNPPSYSEHGGAPSGEVMRQSPGAAAPVDWELQAPVPLSVHHAAGRAPPKSSLHPAAFASFSAASLYPESMTGAHTQTSASITSTTNTNQSLMGHIPPSAYKYGAYGAENDATPPPMDPSYPTSQASCYPLNTTHQNPHVLHPDKRGSGHGDEVIHSQGVASMTTPFSHAQGGGSSPKRSRHETTYYYHSIPSQSPPPFAPRPPRDLFIHHDPPFGGSHGEINSGRNNGRAAMAPSEGLSNRNDSNQVSTAYEELQHSLDTWWASG